jgi:hypothetical protein
MSVQVFSSHTHKPKPYLSGYLLSKSLTKPNRNHRVSRFAPAIFAFPNPMRCGLGIQCLEIAVTLFKSTHYNKWASIAIFSPVRSKWPKQTFEVVLQTNNSAGKVNWDEEKLQTLAGF